MKSLFWTFSVLLMFAVSEAKAGNVPESIERFEEYIHQLDESGADSGSIGYAENVARAYEKFLSDNALVIANLKIAQDDELASLFRVSYTTVFYTVSPRYLGLMEQSFSVMQERGTTTQVQREQLYGSYIRVRLLDKAVQLAEEAKLTTVRPVPPIWLPSTLELENPALYKIRKNEDGLILANRGLGPEFQIIVTMGPYCAPSRRALNDISQDPELSELLTQHAIWLFPPDGAIHFVGLKELSEQYPSYDLGIAYSRDSWPMVDSWSTPIFYFLRRGQVVAKVAGWPEGGRADELRKAIETWQLQR